MVFSKCQMRRSFTAFFTLDLADNTIKMTLETPAPGSNSTSELLDYKWRADE
jgi:hypothetical protein